MYQQKLASLRKAQNNGDPGSLGPVTAFKGEAFFDQFANLSPSVRDLLEAQHRLEGYGEYFVCGDLHGDLLVLLGVLRLAGLIDDDANWLPKSDSDAPRRCFVQLGDMVDRGGRGLTSVDTSMMPREELNMMEYLHSLNDQAMEHGDRVVSVSGNHEMYAVEAAFNSSFAKQWNFETKATACPFPQQGISRSDLFRKPGALRYFAFVRPPILVSSIGWLFCHGDIPVPQLREFLKSHSKLLRRLRGQTRVPFANCVVAATNMLWATHILMLGGDSYMLDLLRPALPGAESSDPNFFRNNMSPFPLAVCTCRTLANMGDRTECDCEGTVEAVAQELSLDWETSGGIALGHTVQARLSSKCGGKVQLLDLGMSEAFRGYNKDHRIGLLRIFVAQELEHRERGVFTKT